MTFEDWWDENGNDNYEFGERYARKGWEEGRKDALLEAVKVCEVMIESDALSFIEKYRAGFIRDEIDSLIGE
jgi:hypothetical protein